MNKTGSYLSFWMVILCGGSICSCEEEKEQNYNEAYTQVDACIHQNKLLLKVEQETENNGKGF